MTLRSHRYLALADALLQALRAGRYRPGDRLPSVRELCRAHGLSLATVTHALHRLEDGGWLESRPRQGFFVRTLHGGPPPPAPAVAALQLEDRRQRLMAMAATQPGQLSLGHLALPPALLPLAALRRLVSRQVGRDPAALASGSVFGSPALREQLAQRLARAGARVGAEDVVLTQGDGESLQLCLGLLARPGDRIAVATPGSLRVLEVLAALGLQALELPLSPRSDAAVEALLVRQRPAACIIDLGLFPAAAGAPSDADKQALVDLLATHGVPLIEFDLMGELHLGAERPLKAFDRQDGVIHCGSLACITGPGFSLGYVASGRHRLRLRAARAVHGELIPQLTDQVLAAFLAEDGFDAHLRRLRRRLRQQLAAWTRAVEQCFPAGTRIATGEVGYVLWVALPEGVDAVALLAPARASGYGFVPGAVFSATGRFDHCLRLAAGHPLDEARLAGLRLLGAAAHRLVGAAPARS